MLFFWEIFASLVPRFCCGDAAGVRQELASQGLGPQQGRFSKGQAGRAGEGRVGGTQAELQLADRQIPSNMTNMMMVGGLPGMGYVLAYHLHASWHTIWAESETAGFRIMLRCFFACVATLGESLLTQPRNVLNF